MRVKTLNQTLRIAALLAVIATALLLSGCSLSQRHVLPGVSQAELSAGQEPYFNVGGVTYQVQESRQLNPFSDDVQYFGGLTDAQSIPGSDFWFGVFLWAKNQNKTPLHSAVSFTVTDSQGDVYKAIPLNPSLNPFAWQSELLQQNQVEPDPDSIAANGDFNGQLLLFEMSQAAYQNRPLTLHIYPFGSAVSASVSLDL